MGLLDEILRKLAPRAMEVRQPPPPDPGLLARLEKVRRSAWIPVVEPGDGPPEGSKFSGLPALARGELWPTCPSCRQPMQLFLQLNAAELPPELGRPFGEGLLQFFYCIDADCPADPANWEPFSPTSLLRVVPRGGDLPRLNPVKEPLPPSRIVGWTRAEDYPNEEERGDLGEVLLHADGEVDEAAEEEVANRFPLAGPKLGGWPYWVQGVEYPNCPRCGERMVLLFQIDSDEPLPYMFGDSGCGHITHCPKHPQVLAFGWACC